jgi:hypothetical protein
MMIWHIFIMTNLIRQASMSSPIHLSWITKLGIILAIGSVISWLLLLVLPFLPLSLTERAIPVPGGFANVAAGLLVMAEVMFWLGAILTGQEIV